MAPTLLDLAGAPPARGMQGRSLIPVVNGDEPGRDAVFAFQGYDAYPHAIRARRQMVRTRDWKLIHIPEGESLLFDLRNDPHEMHNRYGDPDCRDIREALKDRLLQRHLEVADTSVPSLFVPDQTEAAKQWIKEYLPGGA